MTLLLSWGGSFASALLVFSFCIWLEAFTQIWRRHFVVSYLNDRYVQAGG